MKGKLEAASEVLTALNDVPEGDETVKGDITRIQQSLAANSGKSGSTRGLLRMGDQRIFNRAMIAILGQLFQQMCGTSITVAYAVSIFEERLGFDAVKSRGLAISLSSLFIFGGAATVCKFFALRT